MRTSGDFLLLRVVGGSTAALLAVITAATHGVNGAFLILTGAAAVVFAFPWQRLSALRAGPIEFSLEQGQIRGAIDAIDVHGTERERIDATLSRLATDIELARGSRVLWVDDKPRRLVGERRLFRALGIETVSVPTCRMAAETLVRDNDFDLLITSLEKAKEREEISDLRNPGVLFVNWLRGNEDDGIRRLVGETVDVPVMDTVINNLAVVFYAAFPLAYIRETIQPLTAAEPTVEASRGLDELLRKSLRLLADLRSNPIEVSADKKVRAS